MLLVLISLFLKELSLINLLLILTNPKYLEKDENFQELAMRFEPGEDDIEIFKGTKHRNRMIYPIEDDYEDFENKHYE